MLLDILIPTSGQLSKLQPLMASITSQTFVPDRVVFLLHKQVTRDEVDLLRYFLTKELDEEWVERILIISHLNSDYEPGHWRGYDRNYLLSHAKAKFVFMIDHDNQFGPDLFEKMAEWYTILKDEYKKDLVLSPTIMRRDSGNVQSQWITSFSFLLPKYGYHMMGAEQRQAVKMIGANSLWATRELFLQFPFDERFKRSYEDIDFSYRVTKAGYPLIVLNKVEIQHMEANKSFLDTRLMGNPASAYERARNRIRFVKKNANFPQKLAYFSIWVWWQTLWFFWLVLRFGWKERVSLWKALWFGTLDGLLKNKE